MDENIKNSHQPSVGHETTDVNVWAIGKFGIALTVVTLLSVGLLVGLFQYFKSHDDRQAKAVEPAKMFPGPQLLSNEPKNLTTVRAGEEQALTSYGWVDQQKGVVRIPVDQAIDVLARRGLPVRQQTNAAPPGVSMPTESGPGLPPQAPGEEGKK